MYDRLRSFGIIEPATLGDVSGHDLLTTAALIHEVGRVRGKKGHRKRAGHMVERLDVPPGWKSEHLRLVSFIARSHRGSLPFEELPFQRLARLKRKLVACLGGIIRLAEALDRASPVERHPAVFELTDGFLVLRAEGYKQPENIAAACYLLETACNVPIFVRTANDVGGTRVPHRRSLNGT
jgi:exopolyphosphatase/guanosine-5'-triphosphate,3'-diphosphate pyrophosphatase